MPGLLPGNLIDHAWPGPALLYPEVVHYLWKSPVGPGVIL
jgi:hypothetical protein